MKKTSSSTFAHDIRQFESHGGRVEASSEGKNKGSTFTIVLPVE